MSPAEILAALRDHGVTVRRSLDQIDFEARTAPPAAIIDAAKANKPGLLRALDVETWWEGHREDYEERAAILEYDAGFCRDDAEDIAYEEVSEARAELAKHPLIDALRAEFPGAYVVQIARRPPEPEPEPRWCPCHAYEATAGCPLCGLPPVVWRECGP